MSISIVGVVVVVISIMSFLKNYHSLEQLRWSSFKWMIVFSVFVNIGFIVQMGITLRYFLYFELIYIIISYVYYKKNHMNLSRKGVVAAYIFMTFLVLNIANLLLNPYMEAIPDPEYDTLFRTGIIPMIKPQLTNSGIASMAWILLFVIAVIFSKDYFVDKHRVEKILGFVKKAFEVYFVIGILEFIISNFISENIFRRMVLLLLGTGTDGSFFQTSQRRSGFYCIITFFSEPSGIITVLIYYLIEWRERLKTVRDVIFHYMSIFVIVVSSSASALSVLPIALLISMRKVINSKRNFDFAGKMNAFLLVSVLGAVLSFIYIYQDLLQLIWSYTEGKVFAYITGQQDGLYAGADASGGTRYLGNKLVYQVFLNAPILGSGLGAVNAFNTIYAFLAMFGLVGVVAYSYFIKNTFYFSINKKNIFLFIIVIFYFANSFHEYSFYVPAIIPVWLLFNKHIWEKNK